MPNLLLNEKEILKMSHYFYDCMKAEDLEKLPYLPTTADLLVKIKNDYADLPAISDLKTTYTYAEFCKHIAMRRDFINRQGISENGKIAVMSRNDFNAMELFFAITSAGYTLIMLPNALGHEQLMGVCKKFDIEAMFVAEEFMPIANDLPCKVLPADSIGTEEAPAADVKKDTIAAIYFTGGTTGAPKGAVLTHGAIMRGAHNGILHCGQVWNNVSICFLPLSHIFGSVMGFLSYMYTGALVYTCTDMRAAIGTIPMVRPTSLTLVPGMVEIIMNIAKMKGKEFLGGRLTAITCGAAPVPVRLMTICKEYGIHIMTGYGMTEGANLTSGNMESFEKPTSMGHVYPDQEYKIVDGELWIKGDNVMLGYYKEPEKTAEVMEDGWLKTGDLVEFDEEGYIYIVGRIKNLIILSNGENVSPEEIEDAFLKHSVVKECVVSEIQVNGNPAIGIEIFPYMPEVTNLSDEEIQAKMQQVADEVNATMPSFKKVSKVTIRKEEFPKTGAMKIDRKALIKK